MYKCTLKSELERERRGGRERERERGRKRVPVIGCTTLADAAPRAASEMSTEFSELE